MTVSEQAVRSLRAYAKYMDEHAEAIIGDIDSPNWVTEGGIYVSFHILCRDEAPTLTVNKDFIVVDAWDVAR